MNASRHRSLIAIVSVLAIVALFVVAWLVVSPGAEMPQETVDTGAATSTVD